MSDARSNRYEALSLRRSTVRDNETSSELFDFEEGAVSPSPEILHDSGSGPLFDVAPATMTILETTKGADGKRRSAGLELVDGTDLLIGSSERFDEKGYAKRMLNSSPLALDDSSSTTAQENRDSSLQCTAVSNPRFMNSQSGVWDASRNIMAAVGTSPGVSVDGTIGETRIARNQTIVTATTAATTQEETTTVQHETSVGGIAEAYLVDEELIFATSVKPWWKQMRLLLLLAFVITVVVVAIVMGVVLPNRDTTPAAQLNVVVSHSPSISVFPSSSMIPSASPTNCADIITSSRQNITLLNPNPRSISTALDGNNLLVASIWHSELTKTRSFYVEFYSLKDGSWERMDYFITKDVEWKVDMIYDLYFNTALSGTTAVIGVPSGGNYVDDGIKDGEIFVYKQNSFGLWEEVDPPRPANRTGYCSFGELTDVDGDLLVVTDEWLCGSIEYSNAAYIFRQYGNGWNEVQVLDRENIASIRDIAISGNTIAVLDGLNTLCENVTFIDIYDVNLSENQVTYAHRIEPADANILSLSLKGNELLCCVTTDDSDDSTFEQKKIMVYVREASTKTFTFVHSLNAPHCGGWSDDPGFAFDGNILFVKGRSNTHVFSRQFDGIWVATWSLDQSYRGYQFSGRRLIGITQSEVHSMNLEGCMQDMPTGAPSIAATPNTCEFVNVTFSCNPDRRLIYGGGTACIFLSEELMWYSGYWEARIETLGLLPSDAKIVETFKKPDNVDYLDFTLDHEYSDQHSACIRPGKYQFVFSAGAFQNSKPYVFHYRVEMEGRVIAEEQVTLESSNEIDQRHVFSIPFDPSEEISPTGGPLTPKPTTSPNAPFPTWSTSNSSSWWPTPVPSVPVPSERLENFTATLTNMPSNSLQTSNGPEMMLRALDP